MVALRHIFLTLALLVASVDPAIAGTPQDDDADRWESAADRTRRLEREVLQKGWRAPYLRALKAERRYWPLVGGAAAAAGGTIVAVALLADRLDPESAGSGPQFSPPFSLVTGVHAAAVATWTSSIGMLAAHHSLRIIDRRLRSSTTIGSLARDLQKTGMALTTAGFIMLNVTVPLVVLTLTRPLLIPLASATLLVASAFLHAGSTWLRWARRFEFAVEDGRGQHPIRARREHRKSDEGAPLFKVALP